MVMLHCPTLGGRARIEKGVCAQNDCKVTRCTFNQNKLPYVPVRINNLPTVNSGDDVESYVANTPDDCRDSVDRDVFMLVQSHGTVITMGKTIGEPV